MIQFKDSQLKKIGWAIVALIDERTQSGIDKNGKEFKAYSTRPFKMPYGSVPNKTKLKQMVKSGQAFIIEGKDGSKQALIKCGYAEYKKRMFSGTSYTGKVNLMLTGRMLGAMTVLQTGNNTILIGFANREMAERASQNIERGRDFLGLPITEFEQNENLSRLINDIEGIEIK